jgi:hypothetical protein
MIHRIAAIVALVLLAAGCEKAESAADDQSFAFFIDP